MKQLFRPPVKYILSAPHHYVEYRSTSLLNSGGSLEFSIPPSPGQLIDFKNTRLYVKVKIIKEDGTHIGIDDLVGPINIPLHSMFKEIELYLNPQKVPGGQHYPYLAYFKALLEKNRIREKSLTCMGYYKDYFTKMDCVTIGVDENKSLVQRFFFTK